MEIRWVCVTALFVIGAFLISCAKSSSDYLLWEQLTNDQISTIKTVVLPLGATEDHGPHLPLGTDTLLAYSISLRASTGMHDIAVLPASSFGASFEHSSANGTLAIKDSTLNALWDDIFESVVRAGIQTVACINAHGGQTPNVEILVRSARFRHDLFAVAVNIQQMMSEEYRRIDPDGADAEEVCGGIHGGLIETSVMMHLFPDLVKKEKISYFRKNWEKSPAGIEPYGKSVSFGWKAEDLFNNGAVGNASAASEAIGREIVDGVTGRVRRILSELRILKQT